jgi:hypothetical protein
MSFVQYKRMVNSRYFVGEWAVQNFGDWVQQFAWRTWRNSKRILDLYVEVFSKILNSLSSKVFLFIEKNQSFTISKWHGHVSAMGIFIVSFLDEGIH